MKPKPKKFAKKESKSDRMADSMMWGPEPKWGDKPVAENDTELGFAINWYSYMSSSADQAKWTLDYLRAENQPAELIKQLAKVRDAEISPVGSIFRMLSRGAKLSAKIKEQAYRRVKELAQKARNEKPEPIKMKDYAEPPLENAFIKIEGTIERIRRRKLKVITDQEMSWSSKLTPQHLKIVAQQYKRWLDEMQVAASAKDAYIRESYSQFSTPQLKTAVEFLTKVVELKPLPPPKPPKVVRKATPEQVTSKVLFLKSDPENGVVSIEPQELVGTQYLWVWNAKTRRLGVYIAQNSSGLTVNRTTMQNYQEQKSVMKVLRKPKETLRLFMRTPDTKLMEFFNKIKTAAKPMNNRLNRDIVLLKVVRSAY